MTNAADPDTSQPTAQFVSVRYAAPTAPLRHRAYGKSDAADSKIWPLKALLKEANRSAGNSVHVETPEPPMWLEGSASLVEARALTWHAQARTADGRKLYKTSPALAGVVVSYPRTLGQEGWIRYRDDIIKYYWAVYGERVAGIVEHDDEAQHHIHLYLVPLEGEEFGVVHPGIAARQAERRKAARDVRVARDATREAKRRGDSEPIEFEVDSTGAKKRKQIHRPMAAFKSAMSRMQDAVFEAVSRRHGLTRVGPKRRRLERAVHLKQKWAAEEAAEVVAQAKRKADETLSQARSKLEEALQRADAVEARWAATQELLGRIQALMSNVAAAVDELGRLDRILYSKGAPGRQLQDAEERVAVYQAAYTRLASQLDPSRPHDLKFVPAFAQGNHALVQKLTSEYEVIAKECVAALKPRTKTTTTRPLHRSGATARPDPTGGHAMDSSPRTAHPNFIDVSTPLRPQAPVPGSSFKKPRR
jgi:hypothetical protein